MNLYQAVSAQLIQIPLSGLRLNNSRGPLDSMLFVSVATLFHT
ncbi:hypothetical protein BVI434_1290019 [Burkholderia vietnamiensis]|nr:hypothetical protein BVI434_1290019 [Burkholderia vietnamiensis]CAG9230670.1 hypothetical protein BVI1335_750012 [Burkholderia vietnamiensis]